MKTPFIIGISFWALVAGGCRDREAEARKAREDAEAKARAAAARKEMETLPNTFKSRDIFKQNEAEKKSAPAPQPPKATP